MSCKSSADPIHRSRIWYNIFWWWLVRKFNAVNVLQALDKFSSTLSFA